jgi:hypothetical protein
MVPGSIFGVSTAQEIQGAKIKINKTKVGMRNAECGKKDTRKVGSRNAEVGKKDCIIKGF